MKCKSILAARLSRIACVLAFACWPLSLFCQTNMGRILGNVASPTGSPLPDSMVTVSDTLRGTMRVVVTDRSGTYLMPDLEPGQYHVRAEADGYTAVEKTGIEMQVGQDLQVDFVLPAGEVSQKITVNSSNSTLDTVNDVLGGTLANKQINQLPLNGRDFENLVVLRPGVMRYPGGGIGSISANGLRSEENDFMVDGAENNDPYFGQSVINGSGVQGTPASILPIDSIQEFNDELNPNAEYGWKPGAIVNVGLKSGTNGFHGTAYDFERNAAFDARNFFNPAPDAKQLRLHQFGGTLGGPVLKDRLFFFEGYEGVRSLVGVTQVFPPRLPPVWAGIRRAAFPMLSLICGPMECRRAF